MAFINYNFTTKEEWQNHLTTLPLDPLKGIRLLIDAGNLKDENFIPLAQALEQHKRTTLHLDIKQEALSERASTALAHALKVNYHIVMNGRGFWETKN